MTPGLGAYFVQHSPTGVGARIIQIVTRSPMNHAGIYAGGEQVIEALSAGVTASSMPPSDTEVVWSHMALTDQQRIDIVNAAHDLIGTPYGWLDVIALGLLQWGIRAPSVLRRVQRTDHLFCSQLVDEAYRRAGIHLFNDGRSPQDVTPGDLYQLILKEPSMTLLVDTEGTVHATRASDAPGAAVCGYPPRRADGSRWSLGDAPRDIRRGDTGEVTCKWCENP